MIIAINNQPAFSIYTGPIHPDFNWIIPLYADDHFVIIANQPALLPFATQKNCTPVSIKAFRNNIAVKIWNRLKLPSLLKKNKAGVIVHTRMGFAFNTTIPQLLYKPDWHELPKKYPLAQISKIIVHSEFQQKAWLKLTGCKPENVLVMYDNLFDQYALLSPEEKEEIRNRFTDGKLYFVYAGTLRKEDQLITILKAFSQFKKRLKSNMKLAIASDDAENGTPFLQRLQTYKYKEDVVFLKSPEDVLLNGIIASAYAFIAAAVEPGNYAHIIRACQNLTPLALHQGEEQQEICAGAALYFDAKNHLDIADKMMQLYKDEDQRNQLITNALPLRTKFGIDESLNIIGQVLQGKGL